MESCVDAKAEFGSAGQREEWSRQGEAKIGTAMAQSGHVTHCLERRKNETYFIRQGSRYP